LFNKKAFLVDLFFISLCLLILSALLSFLSRKGTRHWGCGGVFAGSAIGLVFSVQALVQNLTLTKSFGILLPSLSLTFGIDALSAFFLVAIFGLSLLTSLYAWGYLENQDLLLPSLPFFPLLVASMAAVVTAQDGFLFLICWEMMSLTSFFLVVTEHKLREVRHAGWIYLVATHLATTFLIVFFVLLYKKTGSFLFDDWALLISIPPFLSGLLFFLALVGFGTKAGIFPFHVWLPHAHPAAPSYISALMSGVMIKTGIYGLLRALTFLGLPPLWWGGCLVGIGILSAVFGVLYALVQHDVKRLLAYHSVENIGIIMTGIGLGLIGIAEGNAMITLLGLGGGLLHVWNHAIFKGLLFMGAGSVLHVTHTRMIEQLGGLLKKMPVTGVTFLMGAVAICGLPPLNGFISEFLIYSGLFRGAQSLSGLSLFLVVIGIVGIAFAGGLALACFTKVFGVVFLGEPRSCQKEKIHEVPLTMQIPLIVLSLLCLLGGIFPQFVWSSIARVLEVISPLPKAVLGHGDGVLGLLHPVVYACLIFLGLGIVVGLLGRLLYRGRTIRHAVTWDCGYAQPSPRMQYTASSFAQPIAVFFRVLFRPHLQFQKPGGIFPGPSSFAVQIADFAERIFFQPLFSQCDRIFGFIRKIQKGRVQNYLALIFMTLIVLLLWEVWFGI